MKSAALEEGLRGLGWEPEDAKVVVLIPLLELAWVGEEAYPEALAVLRAAAREFFLPQPRTDERLRPLLRARPDPEWFAQARRLLLRLVAEDPSEGFSVPLSFVERLEPWMNLMALQGHRRLRPDGAAALRRVNVELARLAAEFDLDLHFQAH